MLSTYYSKVKEEQEMTEHTEKLNRFLLGVSPFYRESHMIYMNDHLQLTKKVQNLIFYNKN